MIGGLCPDVSNGPGYCKSFAVPTTLASSDRREIKSIQTIIPVNFPRAQWGMNVQCNKIDTIRVIETLSPRFQYFSHTNTSSNKYLLCGDFVTLWHNLLHLQELRLKSPGHDKHWTLLSDKVVFPPFVFVFLSPHSIIYWFIIALYNLPAKKNNSKIIKLYC